MPTDTPEYLRSPLLAPDELLAQLPDDLYIFSAAFDPLLDDAARFLQRLDKINKPYKYLVFELPHGWLNFANAIRRAHKALARATNELRNHFPGSAPETFESSTPSLSAPPPPVVASTAAEPHTLLSRMSAAALSPLSLLQRFARGVSSSSPSSS